MDSTDNEICRMLASLLVEQGVTEVVTSPGSRCAPLVVAVARQPRLRATVVVDERSAAFIALGKARAKGRPVALVCTSGTAVLNYAPAVAEAYYSQVPLVVISADRPAMWIDQADSQTLRQDSVLAPIVKASYDIDASQSSSRQLWYANRRINEALLKTTDGACGPVHINLHLDTPLGNTKPIETEDFRTVRAISADGTLSTGRARQIAAALASPRKVMIVAGGMAPDSTLNRALCRLAAKPNIVVVCQPGSNIHCPAAVTDPETVVAAMSDDEKLAMMPDLVISAGGAVLSGRLKQYLREQSGGEQWHVGVQDYLVDTYMRLTADVRIPAPRFMAQMASGVQPCNIPSEYSRLWQRKSAATHQAVTAISAGVPWSDLKAVATLMPMVPETWNLQVSNGTSIRYVSLFDYMRLHRVDCNRGVSGIDGSTSTAVGAATMTNRVTLLITGDMSAQYDVAALASVCIPPTFKMVVINNGGGGIFRGIPSTSKLDECAQYFSADVRLPIAHLCRGYGLEYYEARDAQTLVESFKAFAEVSDVPAVLNVITPAVESAEAYKSVFAYH